MKLIHIAMVFLIIIVFSMTVFAADLGHAKTTIDLEKNLAYVDSSDTMFSVDKFIARSNDSVTIEILTNKSIANLCFRFNVSLDTIKVQSIKIDGFLFFDTDLSKLEERNEKNGTICYNNIELGNDKIVYKLEWAGQGSTKYDVLMDSTVLDPYVIGYLQTSQAKIFSAHFNNSLLATGYNSTNISSSNIMSYQEFANYSTYSTVDSGGCSFINPTNAYDGNYATFAYVSAGGGSLCRLEYIFDYYKPAGSQSAIWQVKDYAGTTNISLPAECFNNLGNSYIEVYSQAYRASDATYYTYWWCSGSPGFLRTTSGTAYVYEEGIYWSNQSISSLINTVTYNVSYYNNLTKLSPANNGSYGLNIVNESNAAIMLNGTTYVNVSHNALFDNIPQATVAFFFYINGTTYGNEPVFFEKTSYFGLSGGKLINNAGACGTFYGPSISNNRWYHVALSYDGTTCKMYLNGVLVNSTTGTGNFWSASDLMIGEYTPVAHTYQLNGSIDEFYIYNYALSPTEIETLAMGYNASLQINVYDEITKNPRTETISLDLISSMISNSYTSSDSTFFINNLPQALTTIRFSSSLAALREYYINLSNLTSMNISLYMISDNQSDPITATIIDNVNNPLQGAYISAFRFFPTNNSYVLVSQMVTDNDGKALLHLEKFNEYYKFTIQYPYGNVIYSSVPAYIINDNLAFQVNTENSPLVLFNETLGISTTGISFDNSTGEFTYAFTNVQGSDTISKLEVYSVSPLHQTLLNSTTVQASAGTLITSIPIQNDTYYEAKALVVYTNSTDPTTRLVTSLGYHQASQADQGPYGLFLTIILTLVVAFTAFYSLSLMIAILPIPMLLMAVLGFIAIPVPMALLIEICAIIVSLIIGY